MGYYEEFQLLIEQEDFSNFLRLWEEYCMGDKIDADEIVQILKAIENSRFAASFGKYGETILQLWKQINDEKGRDEVLRLAVDLQTSNNIGFLELSKEYVKRKYESLKDYNEMLRIVGLRGKPNFQGALSRFELLVHMKKGNFVFHTGGWGVGEIMDFSLLREHALIEFEGIASPKDVSFENAFRNLKPLPSNHFLAKRFGNPDLLEKEAKEDPLAVIHLLLRDLGPKSGAEIKDELCDLVIPESEWARWWQLTRAKIKKDTKIESPKTAKEPFALRSEALLHDVKFIKVLQDVKTTKTLIATLYNFQRDFSEIFKKEEIKKETKIRLEEALNHEKLEIGQKIQILFLLEDFFPKEYEKKAVPIITNLENPESVLNNIEITLFKKRFLAIIRENREDYYAIFSHLFFLVPQNLLREYLFKELSSHEVLLKEKLNDLLNKMTIYPEAFFWYFQKIVAEENMPLGDKKGKEIFLEAFFILLHYIEGKDAYKEMLKKMHNFLSQKRYLLFREIIANTSVEYLQEVLLLASKCHSIDKQDLRVLHSLAEVVQPSLKEAKEKVQDEVIWTTAEGYKKIQERLHHIGTIETVDNAKEIEAARALGDLRENSEYKFALERRSRLQGEIKNLSRQLNKARILTKDDIKADEVSVGSIVDVIDSKGNKLRYTLLGPWDADPDKHILSFQSKLAETMLGHKAGEAFDFQGEKYKIASIKSFL